MEILIKDLLSYSHLGREKMQKRKVNLSRLLKEFISHISKETRGRDIVWKLGETHNVYGEPSMLKLVLVNLIANDILYELDKDNIKFITLRTRSKTLIEETMKIPEKEWQKVYLPIPKRKYKHVRVHESTVVLIALLLSALQHTIHNSGGE